jgi:hypothetical protein
VEFSYTHHGTQTIEYFWNKCKKAGNPNGLTEVAFKYPGMRPQTKETAILMLVDSIEAASRTIDPPDRGQFEIMVQRILFMKLQAGLLDDSGLSMRDLNTIVTRMADTLVNMHHHRIKYPWQATQAEQFGVPSRAVSDMPPAKGKDSSTASPAGKDEPEAEAPQQHTGERAIAVPRAEPDPAPSSVESANVRRLRAIDEGKSGPSVESVKSADGTAGRGQP